MSYKIIATDRFGKELKRLVKKFPSLKNEFSEINAVITRPAIFRISYDLDLQNTPFTTANKKRNGI